MFSNYKNVLILAPHTDDGEFGCGGTISRLTRMGATVWYVAFSAAEQSVLPDLPKDILRTEVKDATRFLGIAPDNLIVENFPVRCFPEYRQEILDRMIQLRAAIQPDLVFLPSPNDTHQDHKVIAEEGFRAFKKVSMLGYEVPWNNLVFSTSAFVVLSKLDLETKIGALACYKSQQHRDYATPRFIESLAITRGTQVGEEYAEAFEMIRLVVRNGQ